MSKSIRIRTTPLGEDKHLKIKIDQDFDFLEILSLKITQEEAYKRYCSDYGVLVGRVVVNNGFGVPNAKVSVFIPIDEKDKLDPIISSIYPFETVYAKNGDGVRYNLLPNFFKTNNDCYNPVGTFSSKREILDCDVKLEVFEKYYKFTTTTNSSGDYMIFGIPVGEQTIHMDVDLSDIGYISQKPYELIAQGYSKKQFISNNQFKKSTNLDNLPQIKSSNSSVSILPFWGDADECEIGISRLDFDLNYNVIPTSIIMGSTINDIFKNGVNKNCRPRPKMGLMRTLNTQTGNIEIIRKTPDGDSEIFVPQGENPDINEDGVYCFQVPMNLKPIITDEFGDIVPSEDPSIGVPTEAKIRMRASLENSVASKKYRYASYLIPNKTNDYSFGQETPDSEFATIKSKKIYTTKQFIPRYQKGSAANKRSRTSIKEVDEGLSSGVNPFPYNRIDPEVNLLFSFLCLFIYIFLSLVVTFNSVLIPVLNFVIALLNVVLSLICFIIFYVIGITIGTLVVAINALIQLISFGSAKELPGSDYCDYCLKKETCTGFNCDCVSEPILPYIPCVTIDCGGESYGPGCSPICKDGAPFCNPNVGESLIYGVGQGYCTSGQPDHYGPLVASTTCCVSCCHDSNKNGGGCGVGSDSHNLLNFYGFMDCFQSNLARSLNLYKLDFYNDYVNGSLYFYAFKYKTRTKKRKSVEIFCDYDCHDDFETDAQGPEHILNDCGERGNLIETCVEKGPGSLGNNQIGIDISEGLIKDYRGTKYYPAYNHTLNYTMFATDLLCIGSTIDCDIDGSKKIIDKLENTTYQLPDLNNEVDSFGSNYIILETGADPLLYNIRCTAPQCYVTSRNCANLRKICEYGLGLDSQVEDFEIDDNGNVKTNTTSANCVIDICDGNKNGVDNEDFDVRNEIAYLNGVQRSVTACDDIYSQYTGLDKAYLQPNTSNEWFGDLRFYNNKNKNSYYFYFGLRNGKTALDCVIKNYFTPCYKSEDKDNIAINVRKVDNICQNQNNGEIDVKIINGVAPYTYTINGPSYPSTQTYNVQGNLINLTNLLSGNYVVTINDSTALSTSYSILINEPADLNCLTTIKDASGPLNKDGSILINTFNGNPPYTYNWIPTPPNNQTGNYIVGLGSGDYSVTITETAISQDCPARSKTLDLKLLSVAGLNFDIVKTDVNCNGEKDGQIVISGISGGTAPYTYYLNGVKKEFTTFNELVAGDYVVTIYDANSAQTQSVNITISQPTKLVGNMVGDDPKCYGCATNLKYVGVSGGIPPYKYFINTPNNNQNYLEEVTVFAGTYKWKITDANGCEITGIKEVKEPSKLVINSIETTNPTCYNGSGETKFNLVGGTAPYTYKIIKASLFTFHNNNSAPCSTTKNANIVKPNSSSCLSGLISSPIKTGSFSNPGLITEVINSIQGSSQYIIEVKDANGCTVCDKFNLISPPQLTLTPTSLQVSPGKYNILSYGGGGTTSSGDYLFNVYKNSVCSGSTYETQTTSSPAIFNNFTSGYTFGNYSVKIVDDNNCSICKPIKI